MGMMLKPRCNRRSGWERASLTKKRADYSVKDQCDVGCVFWLERLCPSRICSTWSDGKQTVAPASFSAFDGCCAQEQSWIVGKPDLDVAPWQCAGSRVAPHLELSGKTSDILCAHPPYSPDLAPADFFLFPKFKTTLKVVVSKSEEIQKNAIRKLRAFTESAFLEAFQQWKKRWEWCVVSRGDYFEGDSA